MKNSNPTHNSQKPASTDDQRWKAVFERDSNADGHFFYSVRTTGVYCRPTCKSRLPNRANVAFFASANEARRAGFRPCKRCRPDDVDSDTHHSRLITDACRLIESADGPIAISKVAKAVGLSDDHFRRLFRNHTGVNPKEYAKSIRRSRFEEERRAAKTSVAIRFAVGECWLGAILVAATMRGICAILLGDDADDLTLDLQQRFPEAPLSPGDNDFDKWVATVVGYVNDPSIGWQLPLDIRGTAFRQRVWRALSEIPLGETTTYAEIAAAIGSKSSVRAVGGACGANPLALAIPCHRVVRVDGSLSGYRWGIERKRKILDLEAQLIDTKSGSRSQMKGTR